MLKTHMTKKKDINKKWYLIDANGKILGRLAAKVAGILRGKNKPNFTAHMDSGDHVIVINAAKILVTGKKIEQKTYRHYSGYPGGLKEINLKMMLEKNPARVFRLAVKGMLPKGPLGRDLLKKLKIYSGPEHPHQAQGPELLEI